MSAGSASDEGSRVLVTVCTFRERENLETLIPAIRHALPGADVLIIDDNSPDGTAAFVQDWSQRDSQVHLLLRQTKEGLGAATIAGFEWGLTREYDFLINMDADFSHPPQILPQLLAQMPHADVAIGSRYITGGRIEGWPWFRHVMSRGVNFYARNWLGLTCRDCSGAFRCYRTGLLRQLDFTRFRAKGYAFQEEILYHLHRKGARFTEVPITFRDRVVGTSKINGSEARKALKDIFLLGCDRLFGTRR